MILLQLGALALLSPAVAGNDALIFMTTSLQNFDARIVQQWSGGGGDRWNISNDSNYPFVGREFGGAGRENLKGTQIFGSGYPYGKENSSTVAGRPFPYGLWPLYWGNNTMGSDEYGPALDGLRPGGELVTIPLVTKTEFYNVTVDETYYIIGDRDSALFMMISLVATCHVTPAWPSKFTPTSPNSTVKIEGVIQYYRASSFALASPAYSNALASGSPDTESTGSMPLPDVIAYSKFRQCLDDTIVNSLAIMNEPPDPGLSTAGTYGLIFGILGIPILGAIWYLCSLALIIFKAGKQKVADLSTRKERNLAARERTLTYENYP